MKTIEKEVTNKVTMYEAMDGTQFSREEDCKFYEESALCLIASRFNNLVVNRHENAWKLMGGVDYHTVLAVKIKTEEDLQFFVQYMSIKIPCWHDDNEFAEQVIKDAREAMSKDDSLLIGVNENGDYYYINIAQRIISNLTKFTLDN